ncbi:MAG: LLM class flavin-dependent oxidoreductase [Steroidobacteraceae bacterium]
MTKRAVEVILPISVDRFLPPEALAQSARAIKASGVVDIIHSWDQLVFWWPPHLWTPKNAPLAALIPDLDSSGDAQSVAAYAAASAPGLGLAISTDSIRRGPAELMQTMLTLANMGQGRGYLFLGAGELKQTGPFGWKRAEGIKRMEDHLRFYDAFWKNDSPFAMEGNFWNFKDAWIGMARQHRPKVWALGGGPKLMDLSARYADGFSTMVPNVIPSSERFADFVKTTRAAVASHGRDPEKYDFVPWFPVLIHDDLNVIDRALDNPLVRWIAAVMGRLNMNDWAEYGIESAMPLDWHYSMKMLPHVMPREEVDAAIAKTTRKMAEKTWIYGNAEQVANEIQPIIDAGATHVDILDMLPLMLDPADAQAGRGRQLDVCTRIRNRNPR